MFVLSNINNMQYHIQNQLINFLNTCSVEDNKNYNGFSLIDPYGEVLASYDNLNNKEVINNEVMTETTTIELCSVGKSIVRDFLMEDKQVELVTELDRPYLWQQL